jgi:hypothetical protein
MRDEDEEYDLDSYRKKPLFLKAQEILEVARRVVEYMNEEAGEKLEGVEKVLALEYVNQIYGNALTIPAKIAASSNVTLYDLRMENAAIIRRAAREIMTNCTAMRMFHLDGFEYLNLLRQEADEFRVLFAEWVKTFDPWDYIIDRWGLFNPPGVNYDDKDPDDDLPYNRDFDDDFDE